MTSSSELLVCVLLISKHARRQLLYENASTRDFNSLDPVIFGTKSLWGMWELLSHDWIDLVSRHQFFFSSMPLFFFVAITTSTCVAMLFSVLYIRIQTVNIRHGCMAIASP